MVEGHITALRDHKDMHRSLRVYVVEGQGMGRFAHRLVRDLAPQDPGKDVLVIVDIGHGRFLHQSANR